MEDISNSLRQIMRLENCNAYYAFMKLGEVSLPVLNDSMNKVCLEIFEFIHMLYNNTDTESERNQIHTMLTDLSGQ